MSTSFENELIDVAEWIDRQELSQLQYLVLGLCGACALVEGLDAQLIGYVAPAIIKAWQVPAATFTPVFMSGLAGLLLGCLTVAPLADRFGRKAVLVGSVASFAVFSLLTVTANSLSELGIYRFLTGLGIGGGMPNAIALTFEFFPRGRRAAMTVLMFAGFPLGATLGGLVSSFLIEQLGWQSVFVFGGILPATLAILLVLLLPDSFHHIVLHDHGSVRVAAILNRINPRARFSPATRFTLAEERKSGLTVTHLFGGGHLPCTLLIWVLFSMSLLDIFLISSWLPTILHEADVSIPISVLITSMFQLSGAITCFLVAPLIGSDRPFRVLVPAYLLAALGNALLGVVGTGVFGLLVAASAAGAGVVAGQVTANAFTAAYYPTFMRATGVGWALGIGRIGAIIGPAVGGIMLAMHFSRSELFLVSTVPPLIAVVAVLGIMGLSKPRRSPAESAARQNSL